MPSIVLPLPAHLTTRVVFDGLMVTKAPYATFLYPNRISCFGLNQQIAMPFIMNLDNVREKSKPNLAEEAH